MVNGGGVNELNEMYESLNAKFTTEGIVSVSDLDWEFCDNASRMFGWKKGHYRANHTHYTYITDEGEEREGWNICFTFDAEGANAVKNYLDSK